MTASYAAACYLNGHGQSSSSSLHATMPGYYHQYMHRYPMNVGLGGMPQQHSGKRTRRGGRGRTRRRGRKGAGVRGDASTTKSVENTECTSSSSSSYPWWYDHMIKSGRTPAGISPSAEDGFPVILPSTQCVYLLPHAKNPHRASTYVPLEDRRDTAAVSDEEDEEGDDDTILDDVEDDLEKHIPSYLLEETNNDEDDATSLCSMSEGSISSLGSRGGVTTQWQFDDIGPSFTENGVLLRKPFEQKASFVDAKDTLDEIDEVAVVSDNEGNDDEKKRHNKEIDDEKKRYGEVVVQPRGARRVTFED